MTIVRGLAWVAVNGCGGEGLYRRSHLSQLSA